MPANARLPLPLFALIGILKFSEDRFCLACLRHGILLVSAVVGAASVSAFTQLLNDTYTACALALSATDHKEWGKG